MANFTDEVYRGSLDFHERLFLELFTAVALTSVCCDLLVVFVVVKYQKLHREVTNVILANLNVLQAVFLLSTPITMRFSSEVHVTVFCVVYELEAQMMIGVFCLLALLLLDWYLKFYHEEKYVKFCRAYKFLVGIVYVFLVFGCALSVQMCIRRLPVFHTVFAFMVCSVFLLLFLTVLNVVNQVRKKTPAHNEDGNLGLSVANIFVWCWCPMIFLVVLFNDRVKQAPLVHLISLVFGFTSPIFNVFYLFCFNNSYNVFFRKVLTCRCNDYENETFEV